MGRSFAARLIIPLTVAAARRLSEMNTGVQTTVRLPGEALREVPDDDTIDVLLRGMLDSSD